MSRITEDEPKVMSSRIQDNPEVMARFKKKRWLRICTECGEFLGTTAGWIVHMLYTHKEKEQEAEVVPNSMKQLISFRRNCHDDGSGDDRTPAPSAPSSIVFQVSSSQSQRSDDGSKDGIGPVLLLHPFLSKYLPVKVKVKGGMAGPNQVSNRIPGKDKDKEGDNWFHTVWTQLESEGRA